MIKIINPLSPIFDYLSQSISRMIMLTFILALSLPLVFLLPSLNENIWDDVRNDNLVKHKLLATSLVEPIKLKVLSYQSSLKSLDSQLQSIDSFDQKSVELIIKDFIEVKEDVIAVTLLLSENASFTTTVKEEFQLSPRYANQRKDLDYIVSENRYRIHDTENSISAVFKSTISTQPAILLRHHIIAKDNMKIGTLFVETRLGYMQQICGQISFGNKGHCAIVDNEGKIIAHPNAAWVSQMKSLSNDKIVQQLKHSSSGTLDYFSSVNNEAVIGGFAMVDSLDWGVIISQPKAEIDSPFAGIKNAIFIWVGFGVLVALFIAFIVTRMITRPLNTLVAKAKELDVRSDTYRLGKVPNRSPIEIKVLWQHLAKLIVDFQEANSEVKSLSGSLSKDLRKVVIELRETNLKKTRNVDLLTGITNKECFKTELGKSLQIHAGEEVGIILFDIDNYKSIVTKSGQNTGNDVLKHVANILRNNIRSGDMAVRYNDKDRFAIYINSSNPESLQGTANKLHALVESSPVIKENDAYHLDLSMGLVIETINEKLTVGSLMAEAERVLEDSKYQDQSTTKVA